MKKVLVCIVVLIIASAVYAEEQKEEPKGNLCYTESVEVQKGTSFPVKLFLSNVNTLIVLQIPIYFRSEDVKLTCDSISFVDSRCSHFALSMDIIDSVSNVAFCGFLAMTDPKVDIPPLDPGEGLLATLWFTAPEDTKSGKVELYSGINAVLPHPRIDYSYLFLTDDLSIAETGPQEVECEYKAGYITVK